MNRRSLMFDNLEEAVAECHRLLASGYRREGNWSLGQACRHLRLAQDGSIDGYPRWMSIGAPLRPLLRWLILPRLLSGNSSAGIPTAGNYVPPDNLDDQQEVEAYAESSERFHAHDGYLHPHPGFGRMDHQLMERFHSAHAAHHFSFLIPNE